MAPKLLFSRKGFPEYLFCGFVVLKSELDVSYSVERHDFVLYGSGRGPVTVFLAVGKCLVMHDCSFPQNPKTPEVCSELIEYEYDIGRILQVFGQRQSFFMIFKGRIEV